MFLKSQGFDTWVSPLSSPLCNVLVRTLALTAASERGQRLGISWCKWRDLPTQFPSQTTISVVGQPLIQLSTQGNSFSQTRDPRVMNTTGGWKLGNQESEESRACCCCYSASLLSVTGDKQKSLGRPRIYVLGGLGENTSLAFLFWIRSLNVGLRLWVSATNGPQCCSCLPLENPVEFCLALCLPSDWGSLREGCVSPYFLVLWRKAVISCPLWFSMTVLCFFSLSSLRQGCILSSDSGSSRTGLCFCSPHRKHPETRLCLSSDYAVFPSSFFFKIINLFFIIMLAALGLCCRGFL